MSSLMVIRDTGAAPSMGAVTPTADSTAASRDRGDEKHGQRRPRRNRVPDTTKAEEASAAEPRLLVSGDALRPGVFIDFLM